MYAVSNLVKRKDFKDRPIFVDGIKELDHDKINYFDIPEGESIRHGRSGRLRGDYRR